MSKQILNIEYEKYKLKNGLEVILYQNKALPLIAVNIWYKVGSAAEKKGKTGIAHLFEHMMFQGSEHVPKEMHFKYVQEAGGQLNGSTSYDRTNYYEKLPSNYLELALWLESDRMGYFLPALTEEKLKNQIDVVSNERLERYENQPYGLAWELLISNLYPENHPYSWSTIGYLEDIAGFTMDDVREFFKTFYSPANASLVVAGDFDTGTAKEKIEEYFADIPAEAHPSQPEVDDRVYLKENKNLIHNDNVQLDRIYLAWQSEKAYRQDDAALEILSDILTGSKSARLQKKLVYDKQIAQDVSAYQFSGKLGGHFMIIATAKPGVSLDKLKKEIFDEIENLMKTGVEENELTRSRNSIKSGFIYSMQNLEVLANRLNSYNFYLNEPNSFSADLGRYEKVSEEEISACLRKYFSNHHLDLRIVPKDEIEKK